MVNFYCLVTKNCSFVKKKNFIYVNEQFECDYCGALNVKGKPFIRNHCLNCLCSKHVDLDVPGDRNSDCGGKMQAEQVFYSSSKGQMLVHVCDECGKQIKNTVAPDDNIDLIAKISAKGYVG